MTSDSRLNAPNVLTLLRILAIPVVVLILLPPAGREISFARSVAAFSLFVAATITDLFDGYIARRYHMVTAVGKLLDPLADKLLPAIAQMLDEQRRRIDVRAQLLDDLGLAARLPERFFLELRIGRFLSPALDSYINQPRFLEQPLQEACLLRADVLISATAIRAARRVSKLVGRSGPFRIGQKVGARQEIDAALARLEQYDLIALLRARVQRIPLVGGKAARREDEPPAL